METAPYKLKKYDFSPFSAPVTDQVSNFLSPFKWSANWQKIALTIVWIAVVPLIYIAETPLRKTIGNVLTFFDRALTTQKNIYWKKEEAKYLKQQRNRLIVVTVLLLGIGFYYRKSLGEFALRQGRSIVAWKASHLTRENAKHLLDHVEKFAQENGPKFFEWIKKQNASFFHALSTALSGH